MSPEMREIQGPAGLSDDPEMTSVRIWPSVQVRGQVQGLGVAPGPVWVH